MTGIREIVVATGNPHKVAEIRAILSELGFVFAQDRAPMQANTDAPQLLLRTLEEVGGPFAEPDETGRTFQANARIKAIAYAKATGHTVLADDSGLEVQALHGEPGVDSAVWAGAEGTRAERDARNNAKLQQRMRGIAADQRAARFICCMCLADASGRVLVETQGTFEGRIAESPQGENGFGYDPWLWIDDAGCSSAQLPAHIKNARSHRSHATRKMAVALRAIA